MAKKEKDKFVQKGSFKKWQVDLPTLKGRRELKYDRKNNFYEKAPSIT